VVVPTSSKKKNKPAVQAVGSSAMVAGDASTHPRVGAQVETLNRYRENSREGR
jgi:hypothetical protein